MKELKIPLWLAIISNINVMIGAGVFINSSSLSKLAGKFGCLSYLGVALLILPLVISIAKLAELYPNTYGGLYIYSKNELGSIFGIISGIAYFIGKCFSCAVLSRTFSIYINHLLPIFSKVNASLISCSMIFTLCFLNFFGIKTGSKVQLGFIVFKILPLILVIICGCFIFNFNNFDYMPVNIDGYISSLSIAMYGLLGFESCCAIGNSLSNPKRNLGRAVIISFFATATIYTFFQTILFGSLGISLSNTNVPLANFAFEINNTYPSLGFLITPFLNPAILISVLGSCYGILFFNSWNGYTIVNEASLQNDNFKYLIHKNSYGMPIYPIIFQGILASLLIILPVPNFILAKLAVLFVVITYLLSCTSLLAYYLKNKSFKSIYFLTSSLGIASSIFIAYSCLKELLK